MIHEINLLVVQYNIRQPNVLRRYMQMSNVTIVCGVPFQFVIEPFLKKHYVCMYFIYYYLVTTLHPASRGFATWRRGLISLFCHSGDSGNFLAIFLPILILGQFVITPYSNIF